MTMQPRGKKPAPMVEINGKLVPVDRLKLDAMNVADSSPEAKERGQAYTILALLPFVERAEACERRTPKSRKKQRDRSTV